MESIFSIYDIAFPNEKFESLKSKVEPMMEQILE
jgi:hypothetical protein